MTDEVLLGGSEDDDFIVVDRGGHYAAKCSAAIKRLNAVYALPLGSTVEIVSCQITQSSGQHPRCNLKIGYVDKEQLPPATKKYYQGEISNISSSYHGPETAFLNRRYGRENDHLYVTFSLSDTFDKTITVTGDLTKDRATHEELARRLLEFVTTFQHRYSRGNSAANAVIHIAAEPAPEDWRLRALPPPASKRLPPGKQ